MSAKSIKELALFAERMPWEDAAPFQARWDFMHAMTPELFLQMLDALTLMCLSRGSVNPIPSEEAYAAAYAAIAKATGEAQ